MAETKEAKAARARAYYLANRDKIKAKVAAYKQANPEKVKACLARSWARRSEASKEAKAAYSRAHYEANAERLRPLHRAASAKRRKEHPERVKAALATWRDENPEKVRMNNTAARKRNSAGGALKRNGITHDEVHGWSGGLCTICGVPDGALKNAHPIDHCHVTDKVRGLLCTRCNTALGLFRDNPALLTEALRYLADPPEARRARGETFTPPNVTPSGG